MRACGMFLMLALVAFVGSASGQFVLKSGTFSQSFGPNAPYTSQAIWTVSDNVTFSTADSGTPTCLPDSVPVDLLTLRGGSRDAFVWTYQAGPIGRGDLHEGPNGHLGHPFASINPAMPQTKLSFTVAAHALPKFTASQTFVRFDIPFTMQGTFAVYGVYEDTGEPHYSTAVTGSGTVTLIYNRRYPNVKAWRRNANAELYLSYMSFKFLPPA